MHPFILLGNDITQQMCPLILADVHCPPYLVASVAMASINTGEWSSAITLNDFVQKKGKIKSN